jgi:hypothetical protein
MKARRLSIQKTTVDCAIIIIQTLKLTLTLRKGFTITKSTRSGKHQEIPNGYRGYSIFNKYNVMITDYDDDYICQFINIHKKTPTLPTNAPKKQPP